MDWSEPKRPIEHAQELLVKAIMRGQFPPDSTLPAERGLAEQLGITRPTLREALRRLESDGWLDVQQGKSTRVKNIWTEGGLNVLSSIVKYSDQLPLEFVTNLLKVRLDLAPTYTAQAIENAPTDVLNLLQNHPVLGDSPDDFATYDWQLHHTLTIASGNPVYTLILNGFTGFYEQMARFYFVQTEARESSQHFYATLLQMTQAGDSDSAMTLTRTVMTQSISLWESANLTISFTVR